MDLTAPGFLTETRTRYAGTGRVLRHTVRERPCVDTNHFDPATQVQTLGRLTITLDPMTTKRESSAFKESCLSLTVTHT